MLHICKVQVSPAVIYGQSGPQPRDNQRQISLYQDRMSAISKGQVNFTMNVCQGMKPNEMVIAFVESILAAVDNTKSPWNFQGFHLSEFRSGW